MKNLTEIENSTANCLTVAEVAEFLGANPQSIREQAHKCPEKLGFPVIILGSRIHIPKDGFVYFCKYGYAFSNKNDDLTVHKSDTDDTT